MSLEAAAAAETKLDINRVVRRTIEVLQRNWRELLKPALIFVYAPAVIVGAMSPPRHGAGFPGPTPLEGLGGVLGLLALIPYAMFQAGLIRLTLADLDAESMSTEEALAVGRRRLWSYLGIGMLAALGVALGLVLLIVPGVMLATAWAVVGPVVVQEQHELTGNFRRSAELTRGSRLNILGVGVILILVELLGGIVFALLGALLPNFLARALLFPLLSSAEIILTAVAAAVIYRELRWLKEGASSAAAADI